MKNQELIIAAANQPGDVEVFTEVGGKVVAARGAEMRGGRLVVFTSAPVVSKKTAPTPATAADESDDGSGTMDPPPKPPVPVDPPADPTAAGATIE